MGVRKILKKSKACISMVSQRTCFLSAAAGRLLSKQVRWLCWERIPDERFGLHSWGHSISPWNLGQGNRPVSRWLTVESLCQRMDNTTVHSVDSVPHAPSTIILHVSWVPASWSVSLCQPICSQPFGGDPQSGSSIRPAQSSQVNTQSLSAGLAVECSRHNFSLSTCWISTLQRQSIGPSRLSDHCALMELCKSLTVKCEQIHLLWTLRKKWRTLQDFI